jgi:Phasin protein
MPQQPDYRTDIFASVVAPMQAYFDGLENMGQTLGPMKQVMRSNLEILGLVSRRTQAYMQLSSRIAKCRTPQDLMQEQSDFWRTAFEQYAETSRRVMDAWGQSMAASVPPAPVAEHDYITFPAPKKGNSQYNGATHVVGEQYVA